MVEETLNSSNKPKITSRNIFSPETCLEPSLDAVVLSKTVRESKANGTRPRPKSVYSWGVGDVLIWLRRHCTDYYPLYGDKFSQHDITGRSLVRMNDNSLLRLGITDDKHRDDIWREILKLRLKTDIMEIRDLQRRNTNNMFYDYSIA